MSAFGDLMREMRRKAGLDQFTLAGRLGVTKAHISAIENGRSRATFTGLPGIAEAICRTSDDRAELISAWALETKRWTVVVSDSDRRVAAARLMLGFDAMSDRALADVVALVGRRAA